jgi:hypothetical protein
MALTTEPALTTTGADTRSDADGRPMNASDSDSGEGAQVRGAGDGVAPAAVATGRVVAAERTDAALEPEVVAGALCARVEDAGDMEPPIAAVVRLGWRTLPAGGSVTSTDSPVAPIARVCTEGDTAQLTVATVETEMGDACGVLVAGEIAAPAFEEGVDEARPTPAGCCVAPIADPHAGNASWFPEDATAQETAVVTEGIPRAHAAEVLGATTANAAAIMARDIVAGLIAQVTDCA